MSDRVISSDRIFVAIIIQDGDQTAPQVYAGLDLDSVKAEVVRYAREQYEMGEGADDSEDAIQDLHDANGYLRHALDQSVWIGPAASVPLLEQIE